MICRQPVGRVAGIPLRPETVVLNPGPSFCLPRSAGTVCSISLLQSQARAVTLAPLTDMGPFAS